jgi:hypothetical protein
MAEIDIQEKRGQPAWVWILAALALLVLVGVIWALTRNGNDRDDAMYQDTVPAAWDTVPAARDTLPMRRDTLPAARDTLPMVPDTPTSGLDQADDAIARYVVFSQGPARDAADNTFL